MNEVEIERLVVRLLGDTKAYQQSMEEAMQTTQQVAQQVEQHSKSIEGFADSVKGYAAAAVSGLAGLGALGYLKNAMNMGIEAEQNQIKLTAAIQGGGHDAAALTERYRALGREIAASTTVTMGQTLAMAKQAEMQGFSGDTAERLIRNSIGLAASTDMSAQHAMVLSIALERGNVQMLRRVPQLRGIRDETELVAKAQQLMRTGMEIEEKTANSLGGQFTRLNNEIKGLTRQFGDIVAQGVKPMVDWVRQGVAMFQGMSNETKTTIVIVTTLVAVLAALPALFTTIGAALAFATGGTSVLLVAVVGIGVAIAAWVNSTGGMSKAWDKVKEGATATWAWIKRNSELLTWMAGFMMGPITLAVAAVVSYFGGWAKTWEAIKVAASSAWAWIKGTTMEFVDWATPYVTEAFEALSLAWRYMKFAATATWEWVKTTTAPAVDWLKRTVDVGLAYAAKAWDWLKRAVSDTWEWAKSTTSKFIAWATPILAAWIGYASALWDLVTIAAKLAWEDITEFATTAWDVIKTVAVEGWNTAKSVFSNIAEFAGEVWKSIAGDGKVTWDSVGDFIVDVLIAAEFGLRNLGQVASYVWIGVQVGWASVTGEISHFFTSSLPAMLRWFGDNWQDVFSTSFSYTTTIFKNLVENIVSVIGHLPQLIAGTVDFSTLWTPLTQGATSWIRGLPELAGRELGQVETALRAEFDRQGTALGASFETFREKRLAEIARFRLGLAANATDAEVEDAKRKAEANGAAIGGAFNKGAKKEKDKLDAVLFGSAEAIHRIIAFQERNTIPAVQQAVGSAQQAVAATAGGAVPSLAGLTGGAGAQSAAPPAASDATSMSGMVAGILARVMSLGASVETIARSVAGPAPTPSPESTEAAPNPRLDTMMNLLAECRNLLTQLRDKDPITIVGGDSL